MVIGTDDNGEDNATSNFMNSFFRENSSFVGIDPSKGKQMLVFLLKTDPTQMSNGLSNQTYQMKVFFNPHPFSTVGTQGLDLSAYSNTTGEHTPSAPSCLKDSSSSPTSQIYQCQPYRDHVHLSQIDNTITIDQLYGVGELVCGQGATVTCPSGACG